jgi:hypothetical protein
VERVLMLGITLVRRRILCSRCYIVTFSEDVITAAGLADINIIPLVWTLPIHAVGQNFTANDTFLIKSVPRINALTQVILVAFFIH